MFNHRIRSCILRNLRELRVFLVVILVRPRPVVRWHERQKAGVVFACQSRTVTNLGQHLGVRSGTYC